MSKRGSGAVKARARFLRTFNLPADSVQRVGLEWSELEEIALAHTAQLEELQAVGNATLNVLQRLPEVHSLKVRIKETEHLLPKIIRKRLVEPDRQISAATYRDEITDLVGVRALLCSRSSGLRFTTS
jgi:putative GTP pyrophosphokinase